MFFHSLALLLIKIKKTMNQDGDPKVHLKEKQKGQYHDQSLFLHLNSQGMHFYINFFSFKILIVD